MNNLKTYRIKYKMSQLEVANFLNIKQATYSGYELSKFEPPIETLKKLATLFNTSIDALVGYNSNTSLSDAQIELIDEIKHISDEKCKRLKSYLDGLQDKN